jgi:hypothetical protein
LRQHRTCRKNVYAKDAYRDEREVFHFKIFLEIIQLDEKKNLRGHQVNCCWSVRPSYLPGIFKRGRKNKPVMKERKFAAGKIKSENVNPGYR